MTTFDPTKPVRTRDGRSARIICTDRKDPHWTIVALVTDDDGTEDTNGYLTNGRYSTYDINDYDLINIPERHVRWVNVYPNDAVTVYGTRASADQAAYREATLRADFIQQPDAGSDRIACIRIEFEEGEGLS